MRAKKWKVPFRTIKERAAVVYIYEDDYEGDIITLEAALNPISTEEDTNEDILSPVRSQTGYLRLIDNGDLSGLAPKDNMQHYVELYIDDVLEWCGYMQADTFSEDWDATPIEIEYPLISGLGVLEGLYMNPNISFGDVTLATLLHECFVRTRIDYDYVYIPDECFIDNSPAILRLKVNRYNFFKESGANYDDADYQKYEGWKVIDVISEVCKFFGWTVHEYKKSLFIVNHGADFGWWSTEPHELLPTGQEYYLQMIYENFGYSNIRAKVKNKTVLLSSIEFDGDTHTRDILQGYNKFRITADFNSVGDVVPLIDEESLGKKGLLTVDYTTPTNYKVRQEKIKIFGGGSSEADTEMFQYEYDDITQEFKSIPFDETLYHLRVGACFGEYDLFETKDIPNKKNYDFKKSVILIIRDKDKHSVPTLSGSKYPLIKMRNSRSARYNSGAFVFKISSSNSYRGIWEQTMNDIIFAFDFVVSMRCGTSYWNGVKWVNSPCHFYIPVNSQGKVDDTKTLDMPYNGASGYIMPIKESLSGTVELIIYANGDYGVGKDIDRICIQGLKVEYYPDDNIVSDKKTEPNKYLSTVEAVFRNEKELNLKLATYKNNMSGYGLLTYNGNYIKMLSYYKRGAQRPEHYLLGKLKRVFKRNIERLNLEVERTTLLPYDFIRNGDKFYEIAYSKIDWADEHQTLTLMDVIYGI